MQMRKRLTYANVMSSLAVFLILGGATAFAAVKKVGSNEIKANSIKTGKIVKEAVTAGKIKKAAVTEAKLADGAVTTNKLANGAVTTDKIADNAVTGAKVNEATLGQVPSAATAATAGSVGGNTVQRVFYHGANTSAQQTILSLNGLTLTAKCTAGVLSANATTSVPNTLIHSGGNYAGANLTYYAEEDNFNPGVNFNFLADATTTSDSLIGSLGYSQANGTGVSVVYQVEEFAYGQNGCTITGYAFG
jgi:hypothetical protein